MRTNEPTAEPRGGSWWTVAPQQGFTERGERESRDHMVNSKEARIVGGMTVGWGAAVSGRKGRA